MGVIFYFPRVFSLAHVDAIPIALNQEALQLFPSSGPRKKRKEKKKDGERKDMKGAEVLSG